MQSFAPRDAHVVNSTEVDPQLAGCVVAVPDAPEVDRLAVAEEGDAARVLVRGRGLAREGQVALAGQPAQPGERARPGARS